MTTDRRTIQEWAEERNAVPAYREDAPADERHEFFERGNVNDEYEERDWETFHQSFEDENRAFVYAEGESGESGLGEYEIVDRDEAAARATVEDQDAEERLLDGETVTTEVTETTVVEREIVETDTIESEVTDREMTESRVLNAELTDWTVVSTEVDVDLRAEEDITNRSLDTHSHGGGRDSDRRHDDDVGGGRGDRDHVDYTDVDLRTTVDGDATAEVEETWRIRRESDERVTVESRVVDTDVEEHGNVEEDTVETHIDTEGVQQSIVESDVVETGTGEEVVDRDLIETETVETTDADETRLESRLVERRVYEDEVVRRKRLRFDFAGTEVLDTETRESDLVDSEIVETTGDRTGTDRTGGVGRSDDRGEGVGRSDDDRDEGVGRSDDNLGSAVGFSDDDVGKDVVGLDGEKIGVVVDVEGETLYVEPNPGLFERLEAAMGWESRDEDAHPITADQIAHHRDDEIVLSHAAESSVSDDR